MIAQSRPPDQQANHLGNTQNHIGALIGKNPWLGLAEGGFSLAKESVRFLIQAIGCRSGWFRDKLQQVG